MKQNKTQGLAARKAAVLALTRVIDDGRNLDGLLDSEQGFAEFKKLDDNDKSLVRAIVVSALRHRGEIEQALKKALSRPPPKRARHLIHTLHCAIAQILFLDIPDSAAVNLAVAAIKEDKRSSRFASLANAVLRRIGREKGENADASANKDALQGNVPRWFWTRLRQDYGKEQAAKILQAQKNEPVIDVTVASDPETWAQRLGGFVVVGHTVRVPVKTPVVTWPGFEDGQWWVQDVAASFPVHLMGEIKGKRILELCAAPGGKTAQLVSNGAVVTAIEQSKPRIERLKKNLSRLNLDAELINADLFEWEPKQQFDAVLLDAPCSSTGTIRRHPDVQWTKSEEGVANLAILQRKMIERAVQFLAPGGRLVFSNCSLMREEGEKTVADLINTTDEIVIDPVLPEELFDLKDCITRQGTVRTLPVHLPADSLNIPSPILEHESNRARLGGLDGFFAARFAKSSN